MLQDSLPWVKHTLDVDTIIKRTIAMTPSKFYSSKKYISLFIKVIPNLIMNNNLL